MMKWSKRNPGSKNVQRRPLILELALFWLIFPNRKFISGCKELWPIKETLHRKENIFRFQFSNKANNIEYVSNLL